MKRKRQVTFDIPADSTAKPANDVTGTDANRSLLAGDDKDVDASLVTPFNMTDELEDGVDVGEDGIIPHRLSKLANGADEDNVIGVQSDSEDEQRSESSAHESSPDDWADRLEDTVPTRHDNAGEPNTKRRQVTTEDDVSLTNLIPQIACLLRRGEKGTQLLRRLKQEGRIADLENATELFQNLVSLAFYDAYGLKREQILALDGTKWRLCWGEQPVVGDAQSADVHGPFTPADMTEWANAQYFVQPDRRAWVAVAGAQLRWWNAADIFRHG